MHTKLTHILYGLLIVAVALTACGTPASSTPAVVASIQASPTSEWASVKQPGSYMSNNCGALRFNETYECIANMVIVPIDDGRQLVIHTEVTYDEAGHTAPLTFDAEVTEPNGNFMSYASCTWDGVSYTNPTVNVPLLSVVDTEYHSITCTDPSVDKSTILFMGTFVVPVKSSLVATLTAMAPTVDITNTPETGAVTNATHVPGTTPTATLETANENESICGQAAYTLTGGKLGLCTGSKSQIQFGMPDGIVTTVSFTTNKAAGTSLLKITSSESYSCIINDNGDYQLIQTGKPKSPTTYSKQADLYAGGNAGFFCRFGDKDEVELEGIIQQ